MSSSLPALNLAKTRLAAIQLGQIGSDKAFNLKHAREAVLKAASQGPLSGADMVMLPECFNSPYSVQQFRKYSETLPGVFEKVKNAGSVKTVDGEKSWGIDNKDNAHAIEPTQELLDASETVRMLSSVAKEAGVVLVGGSMPERDANDHIYNTSLVFDKQGRIIAAHRKLHLFNVDFPGKMTFKESETLTPGNGITLFDCEFGRFGLGICYDIRFPEIAMVTGRLGAGAMLYPGAFNTTTGPLAWELLLRARATDNQIYTMGCSPARPPDGYPAWGHSTVVDPLGQVIATCAEEETIIWAEFDPERVKEVRKLVPVSTQRRFDAYVDVAK